MLSATELGKEYRCGDGIQTIFRGLTFHIGKGEVVALVGASGSGKTTLLNLLSGIDTPDEGTVMIDGVDVHARGEPHRTLLRRQALGFVFQFFNLIPTLTVAENVALPMQLVGARPRLIEMRVAELLERVGLPQMQQRYPETLSGGEQQRTAIARALAHRPRLLLADEPTGNLDEDTGEKVIALLTSMARAEETTMLVVTHSSAVARAADRVLCLQHGLLRQL
jgi:putative ABC transport system ATP-binding protein